MKQPERFNPQFDDYQEAASDFAKPIMAHLRKLVHMQCPEVEATEIAIPDAFAERLSRHLQANEVFQSKSLSFRKEYVAWIADAKTDQTRQKRIDESLEWIAQGKGRFWKYEKK